MELSKINCLQSNQKHANVKIKKVLKASIRKGVFSEQSMPLELSKSIYNQQKNANGHIDYSKIQIMPMALWSIYNPKYTNGITVSSI